MGKAVTYNGNQAVIGVDVGIQDVLQHLENVELPGDGYMFVLGKNNTVFAHEDSLLLNQPAESLFKNARFSTVLENTNLHDLSTVEMNGEDYYISVVPLQNNGLKTVAIISKRSVLDSTYQTLTMLAIGAMIAIVIFVLVFSRWCRYLFSPLLAVSSQLQKLAREEPIYL